MKASETAIKLSRDEKFSNLWIFEYKLPTPLEVLESVAAGEGEDFSTEFTGIVIIDGLQEHCNKPEDAQDKGSQLYRTLGSTCNLAVNRDSPTRLSYRRSP